MCLKCISTSYKYVCLLLVDMSLKYNIEWNRMTCLKYVLCKMYVAISLIIVNMPCNEISLTPEITRHLLGCKFDYAKL